MRFGAEPSSRSAWRPPQTRHRLARLSVRCVDRGLVDLIIASRPAQTRQGLQRGDEQVLVGRYLDVCHLPSTLLIAANHYLHRRKTQYFFPGQRFAATHRNAGGDHG